MVVMAHEALHVTLLMIHACFGVFHVIGSMALDTVLDLFGWLPFFSVPCGSSA